MKKSSRVLLVMIASLYAISGTVSAQAAEIKVMESEDAPPVLSFGQVRELRNNFVSWLNKHYRCLYAGKCTRAEKAQVTAEWSRWIKRLGFTVVVGLVYYFGIPAAKRRAAQARQRIEQQMEALSQRIKSDAYKAGQAVTRGALGLREDEVINLREEVSGLVSQAALALLQPQAPIGAAPITQMSAQDIKARIGEIARDTAIAAVKGAIGMPEDDTLRKPELIALVEELAGTAVKAALDQATVRANLGPIGLEVFPRGQATRTAEGFEEKSAAGWVQPRIGQRASSSPGLESILEGESGLEGLD